MRGALPGPAGGRGQRVLRGLARAAAAGASRARPPRCGWPATARDRRRADRARRRRRTCRCASTGGGVARRRRARRRGVRGGRRGRPRRGGRSRARTCTRRRSTAGTWPASWSSERCGRASARAEGGRDGRGRQGDPADRQRRRRHAAVEPRRLLSDCLRDDLGLTGTNLGCEQGVCGSCTVSVDGATVRSCLMFAVQADGAEVPHRRGPGRRRRDCTRCRPRSGSTTACSAGSARRGC